ncbi:MAG: OmpH family outer membrane protein [Kiritimatiellae bacterium]|jgi:Skp family chaperone for outer membrane proteins|nr:OmpH family outer membrane protein [Kiritimatiellia bacterium]
MKKMIMLASLVAMMALSVNAEQKIAVLDLALVIENDPAMAETQASVREKITAYEKQQEEMLGVREEMKKELEEIIKKTESKVISDVAKKALEDQARAKIQEIKSYENDIKDGASLAQKRIADQTTRAQKKILDKIKAVSADYAKKNGYDFVIPTTIDNATGMFIVLYANEKYDITSEIIALINQGVEK